MFSVRFHLAASQSGPDVVAAGRSLVLFYNGRRVEGESSKVKDAAANALAAAASIFRCTAQRQIFIHDRAL
jgi:hypothetical protein